MHAICSKQSEKKEVLPAISKALVLRSLSRTTLPAARSSSKNSSTARSSSSDTTCLPGWIFFFFFFSFCFPAQFHCRTCFLSTPNSLAVSETLWFRRNWRAESLNSTERLPTRHCANSNNEPWEWKQACPRLGLVWRAHLMCSNVWRPYGICDDFPWGTRRGWKKIRIRAKVGGGLIQGIPPFAQFLSQSRGWAYTTRWANTRYFTVRACIPVHTHTHTRACTSAHIRMHSHTYTHSPGKGACQLLLNSSCFEGSSGHSHELTKFNEQILCVCNLGTRSFTLQAPVTIWNTILSWDRISAFDLEFDHLVVSTTPEAAT